MVPLISAIQFKRAISLALRMPAERKLFTGEYLRYNNQPDAFRILLKFNLTCVIPSGNFILGAALNLFVFRKDKTDAQLSPQTVNVYTNVSNFSQGTVAWNNAPVLNPTPYFKNIIDTIIGYRLNEWTTPDQRLFLNIEYGPTGATGGLSAGLSAVNNSGLVSPTIAVGIPIPFNTPVTSFGTNISQLDVDTFQVTGPGTFSVTFILSTTALSLLWGSQVQVDGVPVGRASTLVSSGTPIIGQTLFTVGGGTHTVEIVANGLALSLATGDNASIIIDLVS